MIYQVDRILRDVRVCLDENRTSTTLLSSNDIETLSLDEVIESKLLEAVERVHTAAPYYMLHEGHNLEDAVYWGSMESGWVLLPDDFMRMVVFEMSDWERPVYTFITPLDPLYKRQSSRIKALRGTAQRPVCAIVERPEGKALEFYSCKSTDATLTKGVYMPYPEVDEDGGIDISERCYQAVVYTAAALTLSTCSEEERAKFMFEKAKTYLER